MKIILVGYPGSQCIVKASKYLTSKYLKGFDIAYLNYTGEIKGWSAYLVDYLRNLTDTNIIFALDDYLVANYIDDKKYLSAWAEMGGDVVCVKLCKSTQEEHLEYPVTTQYCIWDRAYLIWLLTQINTPWEFEINGSRIFDKKVLLRTCLDYFCNSSISARWTGVKLDGLKTEDINYILKLLPLDTLLHDQYGVGMMGEMPAKKIVVFGGSGFLGVALIERLIKDGNTNIVAVARNEGALIALKEKFCAIRIIVGDIADEWVVKKAMKDADEVYLLAAMKHVGLAEIEVKSCISTNIIGATNIVSESFITKPKVLVFISTDKASLPRGVYGCSKKIIECLVAEAERINTDTKYRIIRYGNIWGSTGSIITKWKPKLERGEEVILTDPQASRFFWTVDAAVNLIFDCIQNAKDSAPYIPTMKAIEMGTVLDACMEVYGKAPVKIIGLQPGENKIETIDGINFSNEVAQFTKNEFINTFLNGKD